METNQKPKLYTLTEASEISGIKRQTLYFMAKSHKIPTLTIGASKHPRIVIKREDLEAFLDTSTQQTETSTVKEG